MEIFHFLPTRQVNNSQAYITANTPGITITISESETETKICLLFFLITFLVEAY
jgi:hypothetical protein